MFLLILLMPTILLGQVGVQRLGSFDGGPDVINLSGLNVHFEIPIYARPGRGHDTDVRVITSYDSNVPLGALEANAANLSAGSVLFGAPWTEPKLIADAGSVSVTTHQYSCGRDSNGQPYGYSETRYFYIYVDSRAAEHAFGNGYSTDQACQYSGSPHLTTFSAAAIDGSGYLISASGPTATITTPSGSSFYQYGLHQTAQDSNGNKVDALMGSDGYHNLSVQSLTDTVGTKITISGGGFPAGTAAVAQNPLILTYTDSNDNPETVTLSYGLYEIDATLLGVVGGPLSLPASLLTRVTYPDGTFYAMNYATNATGYYTGQVSAITLPTGGVVGYQTSISGTGTAFTVTLNRSTIDGTTKYVWTSPGANGPSSSGAATVSQTTITSPIGEKTVVNFVSPLVPTSVEPPSDNLNDANVSYETSRYVYGLQSTAIRSSMKCYNGATGNCTTVQIEEPVLQISDVTTLDNGQQSQTVTSFNTAGLVTEKDEYDYGSSSPTRKTITTYANLGNGILDRPQSVTVEDASNNTFGRTTYGYDEYAPFPAPSGIPGLVAVSGSRGNQTSIHRWLTTAASIDTHRKSDTAGQVNQFIDGRTNLTQYGFDQETDSCLQSTVLPTPSSGVAMSTSAGCDPNTGLLTSTVDLNTRQTSYAYDGMSRPHTINYPDGGGKTITYSGETLPEVITTTVAATPNPNVESSVTLDGMGRVSNSEQITDPQGWDKIDTVYNQDGLVLSVSNPHRSYSSLSTDGLTTYGYDALGRKILQTNPGNSTESWTYVGNTVTFKDEAGHQWQRTYDALGRLIQVLEPPNPSGVVAETDYTYDLLDNLTRVDQWGGPKGSSGERVRTFTYDALSRLVCAANPESSITNCPTSATATIPPGVLQYVYDGNDNVTTRTDARNVVTSYVYDALNRITSKTYDTSHATVAIAPTSNVGYLADIQRWLSL
jgi:YD repeat-containing protein